MKAVAQEIADNKVLVALEDGETADTLELLLKPGEEPGTRAVAEKDLGPHLQKLDGYLQGLSPRV